MGETKIRAEIKRWRFIHSNLCEPYTNMAIDEAIWQLHNLRETPPTLRIYGWKYPAFSIGYFQKTREILNIEKCQKEGIPIVRRITGGKTIFHHIELTYSITCFLDELKELSLVSTKEGFRIMCLFLLNTYKKLGLTPYFAKDIKPSASEKDVLCFASYENYDIMVNGKKIGGNAQKRKGNLIFQHGSIPLKFKIEIFSPFLVNKPKGLEEKVCALEDVTKLSVGFRELKEILKASFRETFLVDLVQRGLTPKEQKLSLKLREEKYATLNWNLKR